MEESILSIFARNHFRLYLKIPGLCIGHAIKLAKQCVGIVGLS
jgi:hypothetical protein